MLTWLAPWWLLGLAGAVAAPLAAHLLSRRGGTLAGFPAVRFVQQAVADVARLQRPRHWLLLALRVAALALIALAFAQPRWLTASPVQADAGVRVGVIVDNSASMQRTSGGATLFDRARRDAAAMLRSLDPMRDKAVAVLAERSPRSVLPEPSARFTHLADGLMTAAPTQQRGDPAQALDFAAAGLRHAGPGPMRLELFTDAQRTTFPAAAIARWRSEGVTVTVHTLGDPQPNFAVHDARLIPSQPIVGQPALLRAAVRSYAEAPQTLTVRCGEQTQRLHLQPYRQAEAIFEVNFNEPGEAAVGVTLGVDDAMAADNTAGCVVEVAEARPVALVTLADTMDPATAAYYTARALAPSPDGREEGVALSIVTPDRLVDMPPRPGGVWVLVEAGEVDNSASQALTAHLQAGGGVLWVVDSAAAVRSIAAWEPSPIRPIQWLTDNEQAIAVGRFDDPVLAVFEGPGRSTLLDHTFANFDVASLSPQAQAILLASDGSPILATAWHGSGRCAVFAADLSPASTALTSQPAWPALLHQLMRHLAPGAPPAPPTRPGDALPDGAIADATGLIDTTFGRAWVQLDPDESDPRPPGSLDQARVDPQPQRAQTAGLQLRPTQTELWPHLMLIALVLLACETLAAWWFTAAGRWGGADV